MPLRGATGHENGLDGPTDAVIPSESSGQALSEQVVGLGWGRLAKDLRLVDHRRKILRAATRAPIPTAALRMTRESAWQDT